MVGCRELRLTQRFAVVVLTDPKLRVQRRIINLLKDGRETRSNGNSSVILGIYFKRILQGQVGGTAEELEEAIVFVSNHG